jgi:hypothetical protein
MLTRGFSALAAALVVALAAPAGHAQQPTEAQKSAIRANCRSDFMANCSGVQPGGKEAFQCLQRNLGKLSGGCQAAVSAISPAPAAAAPPAAATAPAAPPSLGAAPPAATAPAAKPQATKPATKPATKTVTRPPAAAPPPPPPVAAAPAVPALPPLVLRPMLPARRAIIMGICRGDAERLCPGLPPIGPATLDCLAVKASSLSPTCYEALARVSRP